jgi:hypothetical protein
METLTWHDDFLRTKPDGEFVFGTRQAITDGGFLIAGSRFVTPNADITERREGCIIKGGRACEINHREGEMMHHVHRLNRV